MIERLKRAIDSYWVRSKAFRLAVIIAFFVLVIASVFFLRHIIFHEYYRLMFFSILTILLVVAYKKGYGKRFSPKQRRLILAVSFCLGISIIVLALLRELGWY